MNRLQLHTRLLQGNLLAVIGLCLSIYFCYHALQGERSVVRLLMVEKNIATLSTIEDKTIAEREVLEKKVSMMRPGSIDSDLLEERVRMVLGYGQNDEHVILSN
ncbi:MAG: septum formation initiator family protein [Alphaproteobacteria bacterium]|nr:septum formation initiator family protein [Alphaproteobacteria bacterium]